MANERDFELLDDYLANRMSDQDRSAFEQKLKADPDLQHEYALQKRVIQGIKDARVAQLKSMLNQVPVPSASAGNALGTKIILGTLVTLMIAAAAFWYYRDEPAKAEQTATPQPQQEQQQPAPVEEPVTPQARQEAETSPTREKQVQETDKNQTSAGTEHSRPSLARKPDPVSAPVERNTTANNAEAALSIVIDDSNTAYTFHYKLENGKLMLFGPFEEGGYEVVALSEGGQNIRSLWYENKYYQLDDTGNEIRALSQVTDAALVQKLDRQRLAE